jgi:hypothetical protein
MTLFDWSDRIVLVRCNHDVALRVGRQGRGLRNRQATLSRDTLLKLAAAIIGAIRIPSFAVTLEEIHATVRRNSEAICLELGEGHRYHPPCRQTISIPTAATLSKTLIDAATSPA